jgi:protein pelota
MRITEQENEDGFTGLYMQDLDDLWYLQNIITPGDHVRMTTLRRVEKKDDMTRSKETARKPVTLTITVESLQFQEFSSNLKILGKIVSGDDNIIGEHHSFQIGLEDTIYLGKDFWSDQQRKMLNEATEGLYKVKYHIICLDDEEAIISVLRNYGIQVVARIRSGKSGKDYSSTSNENNYFQEIYETLVSKSVTGKFLLILGQGFTRESLAEYLKARQKALNVKIVTFPTNRSDEAAIYEFLASKDSESIFSSMRLVEEQKLMETFLKNLKSNELAVYGKEMIEKAIETGAIETLLLSEDAFKTEDGRRILEELKSSGASVHVFSSHSDPGNVVKSFGGYCGILRYRLPEHDFQHA